MAHPTGRGVSVRRRTLLSLPLLLAGLSAATWARRVPRPSSGVAGDPSFDELLQRWQALAAEHGRFDGASLTRHLADQ